jgi:outer membrane immunogenic protein
MRAYFVATAVAAAVLSVSHPASAADLPTQMPAAAVPFISPVYNWTGFYIGGHMGTALSHVTASDPAGVIFVPLGASISDDATGFLGGVQFGLNWQTGNLVFGVQGDMSWTSINPSIVDPFLTTTTLNYKTDWLANVTGRVGYAWDNILLYGKGGAAWVHNNVSVTDPTIPLNATGNENRIGWTAGGGLEYGFAPNWTGFIEYDYIAFGTAGITVTNSAAGSLPVSFEQSIQIVKGGINYKFGGS